MIDRISNDNARHLGNAIDLAAFRDGPSDEDRRRARLESILRFRERFNFDFGMNMQNALFFENEAGNMRPHFNPGDWLILDTTRDRIGAGDFYVVQFPPAGAQFEAYPEAVTAELMPEGVRFWYQNGFGERTFSHAEMRSVVVLGAVRAVFRKPNR